MIQSTLPQPIPDIAMMVWLEKLPMRRRSFDFRALMTATPAYSLPVEVEVEGYVTLEATYTQPKDEPFLPGFRRALVEALPPDFFPAWAPV